MASSDWRADLGFSSRLDAVTKITSGYQDCNPAELTAVCRREATVIETKIYDESQSLEEYHRRWKQKLQELLQKAPQPFHLEEDSDPVPSPSGIDIGRYKNATYYREGIFSVVYKAATPDDLGNFPPSSPSRSRLVALKVATPSMMEPPHDSRREAKILELAKSDNVIAVLETFREAGAQFVIVFPFMPFQFDQLLHDEKLSSQQTKQCLRDMLSALAFIHSRGIIHRDVKPSNVLVRALDGPAYLSDFGISWAPDAPGSESVESKITDVGTTCYRPPELLFGNRRYGCSLDMWAAGCTVAEAFVPSHPTLFDSGELGSDLALIQSIFTKLGTPNLIVWPEAADLPDWGKMQFREYSAQAWSDLLPNTTGTERDLVSQLVRYESGARMTAAQALEHPYFAS